MEYGYISDKGITRENNEDYILICEKPNLFFIADGVGGHSAGEIASETACKFLMDYLIQRADALRIEPDEVLKDALELANNHVFDISKTKSEYDGMGTTMVILYLEDDRYTIASVGDSRAYLFDGTNLLSLTKDHSLVQEMIDGGIIDQEEAKTHKYRNVITQSLGMPLKVDPYFAEGTLLEGESILLCTDGLHDYVDMQKIRELLKDYDLKEALEKAINLANASGGNDNCSMIVIKN